MFPIGETGFSAETSEVFETSEVCPDYRN
jgi:hypothetical protein